jgi:hypothetical protein
MLITYSSRQWFLQGFYDPHNLDVHMQNPAVGFSPSGATMKAMLISGATPQTNVTDEESTTYFKNTASFIQGYGSLRLGDIVWDSNSTDTNYLWIASLQANFSDALSFPGQDSSYCVSASDVQYDSLHSSFHVIYSFFLDLDHS